MSQANIAAGTATTATNIAGGAGGAVHYQSAANTTALLGNGAAGQVLTSNGTTLAPSWVSAAPLATTASFANSITGGAGGAVPYQSATNTTALLANGTAGQVLQSNGTTLAPTWTSAPAGLAAATATTATTATNIAGGAGGAVHYQSATNTTALLANGTAGQVLQSNGNTLAPSWVSAAPLATSIAGGSGGSIPYQSAANTTALLVNGASGSVLQSNGSTAAPSWTNLITANLNGNVTGNAISATSATNIQGGAGGSVPYQTAANTTAMLANGAAGQVLQSNGTTLAPTWTSAPAGLAATTATTANTATTATNLAGGFGGTLPYQSAANTTALLANGTAGQVLQSNGTTLAPTWTSAPAGLAAATATTATTATNIAGGTGGAVHYQIAANQTGLLANGVVGTVLQSAGGTLAPRWTTEVPLATSLAGGAGGSIPYQTIANQTALLPNGTINMVLQCNGGTNPPSWTGNPVFGLASNIAGGSGGSIPYQTGTNATSMVANGTVGSVLQSNGGVAAPSWVSAAPLATSIAGGSGGAVHYQSAANTTALLANGTAGQVLKSNGTTLAPSWVDPTAVNTASAANLLGGDAFSIPYQSSINNTAMLPAGTAGQVLQCNGPTILPGWVTTISSALRTTNLASGLGGSLPYQSAANTTAMLSNGLAGQVLQSNGTTLAPSWTNQPAGLSAASAATSTTATNLAAGFAGYLPYQSASNTTAMVAPGAAGTVLKSNGAAAPSWIAFNAPAVQVTQVTPAQAGTYNLMMCSGSSGSGLPTLASSSLTYINSASLLVGSALQADQYFQTVDQNLLTNNGTATFTSQRTQLGNAYFTTNNSATPAVIFESNNQSGVVTSDNPSGITNLLQLRPYKLPVFTYGPVCFGYLPGVVAAGGRPVAPYYLTDGFTVTASSGNYAISWTGKTFIKPTVNGTVVNVVTGNYPSVVSHYKIGDTSSTVVIKCFTCTSSTNASLVQTASDIEFVIYSGEGSTVWN